jgi:predicted secreted protein
MNRVRFYSRCIPLLAVVAMALGSPSARAQTALPLVHLSAQGSAAATNDLARAEAYAEVTGPDVKTVAASVNRVVTEALKQAKRYPTVQVRTTQSATWPVYAKSSQTISGWRMRSTLALESTDIAALSALTGALQASMAIGNLRVEPGPDTLAGAEDAATLAALAAFQARAALVAKALGKQYRIKELNVGTQHMPRAVFQASVSAERGAASPAPVEPGQSDILMQVNGSIELID